MVNINWHNTHKQNSLRNTIILKSINRFWDKKKSLGNPGLKKQDLSLGLGETVCLDTWGYLSPEPVRSPGGKKKKNRQRLGSDPGFTTGITMRGMERGNINYSLKERGPWLTRGDKAIDDSWFSSSSFSSPLPPPLLLEKRDINNMLDKEDN